MKRMYQVIGAVCFVLVVFFGTFAVKADAASGVSAISYEGQRVYTEAFRVLELVNEQRAANGLKPLKMDLTLLETGMKRAEECRIFHSHTRPNGEQYTTLFPHTTYWGENIAIGYPTAEEVVNAWMNSPGHRANILNSRFSSIGIGVFCHNGISAWTQAFSSNDTTGASVISNRDVTAKVSILDENYSLGTYPDTISLNAGATQTVSLHAWSWESGLYFRVYPTGISYRSGNTAVAKVDTQGKVTAVGVGSTTITVSVSGCNKTVSIPVTVACKAHTYAGGVCTACKYEFPLQVKNLSGTYTVIAKSANIWSKPYSTGASKLVRTAAKGTDVTVTGMVTNSAGSLWYKLSDGNWVYSSNVEKKSATYREIDVVPCSGIYAISSNGANIWSKPFTDGTSKLLTTYKKGTQLAIVAKVVNSAGSTWIQLSEGGWVYFGNVTRKTAITYNPENVVTVSGTYTVTSWGANVWSNPFTVGNTKVVRSVSKNAALAVTGRVVNSAGDTWYELSDGNWIFSGNVTRKSAITYNTANMVNYKASFKVISWGANLWSKPYSSGDSKVVRTVAKDATLSVVAKVTNSAGDIWYKLSDGWIYGKNVIRK